MISGTVVCRIGTDVYLETTAGLVLLDVRLLAGWALHRAEPGPVFTAPLNTLEYQEVDHDALS